MEKIKLYLKDKICTLYADTQPQAVLIQLTGDHEAAGLEEELEEIRKRIQGIPFSFVSFPIEDWNRELSPWPAAPVFGNEGFGDGAGATLDMICQELLPALEQQGFLQAGMSLLLGGYSLAGLFALWAGYQTNIFTGILAASPSVWFPDWDSYIRNHAIKAEKLYLSLGDKEARTRNRTMARVAERIEMQYAMAELDLAEHQTEDVRLEWNPGNHFREPQIRMARGFAWLLAEITGGAS